jgi:ATP-dependent DNA helicase
VGGADALPWRHCRFDFSAVHTQDGDQQILAAEAQHQIVSKLHHILKPFLMRRLKADGPYTPAVGAGARADQWMAGLSVVERDLPKKREYLVYTPLTTAQRAYYDAIVNRDIRRFLLTKAAGTDSGNGDSGPTPPRVPSPRALEADAEAELDAPDTEAPLRGRRTASQAPSPSPSPTAGPRRRSMPAQSYKEMTDREFYKMVRVLGHPTGIALTK